MLCAAETSSTIPQVWSLWDAKSLDTGGLYRRCSNDRKIGYASRKRKQRQSIASVRSRPHKIIVTSLGLQICQICSPCPVPLENVPPKRVEKRSFANEQHGAHGCRRGEDR
ncbi:hypothetical protein H920_12217 [Fukomys damarensis]|uniref:Uncharacterized protein n=1 Tax=Fukomys damarensis TaxID=885580 RepID=A0A091D827_FUKDA|nr:hypothetical protein H920_12217 [Fukomys damarensis]